jgi:hypothetical protein
MTSRLLERHRASGQVFTAGGIGSFVLDEGPRDGGRPDRPAAA